ncbi:hypothetical protein AB4383_12230 [Vibrio breoganii]
MALIVINTCSGWSDLYSPYTGKKVLGSDITDDEHLAKDDSILFYFCSEVNEFLYINPKYLEKVGLQEHFDDGYSEDITIDDLIEDTTIEGGIVFNNGSSWGESYMIAFGRLEADL